MITTFFAVGIMGLSRTPLPLDRVHLLNPVDTLDDAPDAPHFVGPDQSTLEQMMTQMAAPAS